ncbi:hypothetical protein SADUNF_Sadunf11G0100900 [Salix dunnii]|uniref:Uncharacterized protein n=1 Tax=Salix dunnii TaxID=1413687 RepID=A0A835MTL0_9ROSI|nr:hypothetical protein SADUNF_Sadunf11G0100900 [Salix dunnii]
MVQYQSQFSGKPTVFINGQAANMSVFTSDSSTLANSPVESLRMILGDKCLDEISGQDHKRVRNALNIIFEDN